MKRLLPLVLLFSCSIAGEYTALKPIGYVQGVTPNSVTVCFPVAYSDKGHSVGCTRYNLPEGHTYQEGDAYPDPSKYAYHFKSKNNKP